MSSEPSVVQRSDEDAPASSPPPQKPSDQPTEASPVSPRSRSPVISNRLADVRTWKALPDDGRHPSSVDVSLTITVSFWRDVANIVSDMVTTSYRRAAMAANRAMASGAMHPLYGDLPVKGSPHASLWNRFSEGGVLSADGLWAALRELGADCSGQFANCLVDRFGSASRPTPAGNDLSSEPKLGTVSGGASSTSAMTEREFVFFFQAVQTALSRLRLSNDIRVHTPRTAADMAAQSNAETGSVATSAHRRASSASPSAAPRSVRDTSPSQRSTTPRSSHTLKSLASQWSRVARRAEIERHEEEFRMRVPSPTPSSRSASVTTSRNRHGTAAGKPQSSSASSRFGPSPAASFPTQQWGVMSMPAGRGPVAATSFPAKNGVTHSYKRVRFDRFGRLRFD